jgi:uncharacterized membrane protein YdjX (TVP38/TMEM64 family)
MKSWTWMALGFGLIIALFVWWLVPVQEWIQGFQQWITGQGTLGYALFALVYIAGAIVLAPSAPLSIAGGVAFGAWGIPLVLLSATVGASLAFLVARYVAQAHVVKLIRDRPKFKAVHEAISSDGWKVVLLLRLSPLVPFNVQNYVFGVTDIPFWHYAAATVVGIIPGTLLSVYVGVMGQAAADLDSIGMLQWLFFGLGLIATILVSIWMSKKAKARLDQAGVDSTGS